MLDLVVKAQEVFHNYKNVPIQDKVVLVKQLGLLLRKNAEKYAEIITLEMHKPITQSIAEVENVHGFVSIIRTKRLIF